MVEKLFSINCETCHSRLAVYSPEAIGKILECPKCESMVYVQAPPGWQAPHKPDDLLDGRKRDSPIFVDTKIGTVPLPEQASAGAAGDAALVASATDAQGTLLGLSHFWFGIVAATLTAAVLGTVAGLAFYLRGNADHPEPPINEQSADSAKGTVPFLLTQKLGQSHAAAEETSQSEDLQESKKDFISAESAPTTAAIANMSGESAVEQAKGDSPIFADAKIGTVPEKTAEGASTAKAGPSEASPSESKPPEASATADEKHVATPKGSAPSRQPMSSLAVTSRVVKSVPLEKINVPSRLGELVPSIELREMPFGRAIGLLASLSGLPITLDADAMERLGVTLSDPITVQMKDAMLEEILQQVCAQRGMAFVEEDGQVIVTSPIEQCEELRRMRYTVADLTGNDKAALENLAALVQKFVYPESWQSAGGQGAIETDKTTLVVTQTLTVHDQILVFCEKLRQARGRPLKSSRDPKRFELTSRLQQAESALKHQLSANFHEPAALMEILAYLGQQAEVDILIDRRALAATGLSDQTEISMVVNKQPLAEALAGLLVPLKLGYRAIDARTLQVTTQAALDARGELEFYPIGKLPEKGVLASDLIERIKTAVLPASWKQSGGIGVIYFDQPSNTLIVLQSQPVQGAILKYLSDSR